MGHRRASIAKALSAQTPVACRARARCPAMIALFRRFREPALAEIEPRDLMAEIVVRDLIYYAWDVMRCR